MVQGSSLVEGHERQPLLDALSWLADAPLFIDSKLVAAFYDAVVNPGQRAISIEVDEKKISEKISGFEFGGEMGTKVSGKAGVKVKFSLLQLFPFLNAILPNAGPAAEGTAELSGELSAKATGKTTGESSSSDERGNRITFEYIDTPQRKLVQLMLHYVFDKTERVLYANKNDYFIEKIIEGEQESDRLVIDSKIFSNELISTTPRALCFIDFPPGTIFLPTALEFQSGKVVTLYDKIPEVLIDGDGTAPINYPDEASYDRDVLEKRRRDYWQWYFRKFNASRVMKKIEEITEERIEWIDYRVPLSNLSSIHLHVCGRGKFSTGTFAYFLVKRGMKHGLRFVGTLKSEPDMDVLAIYEK